MDTVHDLFRAVWLEKKNKYEKDLFPTVDMQREFGLQGLALLSKYFGVSRGGGVCVLDEMDI